MTIPAALSLFTTTFTEGATRNRVLGLNGALLPRPGGLLEGDQPGWCSAVLCPTGAVLAGGGAWLVRMRA